MSGGGQPRCDSSNSRWGPAQRTRTEWDSNKSSSILPGVGESDLTQGANLSLSSKKASNTFLEEKIKHIAVPQLTQHGELVFLS